MKFIKISFKKIIKDHILFSYIQITFTYKYTKLLYIIFHCENSLYKYTKLELSKKKLHNTLYNLDTLSSH